MSLNPDLIQIRIHNSTLEDKFFKESKINIKSKILAVCTIFIPFRLKKIKSTKRVPGTYFSSSWIRIRDPDSQSGSTKSLNPDPIRIRIHNPG
jgi:hypothetical protein